MGCRSRLSRPFLLGVDWVPSSILDCQEVGIV